jgi:hypothetical protein
MKTAGRNVLSWLAMASRWALMRLSAVLSTIIFDEGKSRRTQSEGY